MWHNDILFIIYFKNIQLSYIKMYDTIHLERNLCEIRAVLKFP